MTDSDTETRAESDETADPEQLVPTSNGDATTESNDQRDEPSTDGGTVTEQSGRDLVTYVEYAAFAILCLLALVATFRFYFAASTVIDVWFSSDFVPVFQAVFNLVILVASAIGISLLVRRLR